MKLVNLIAALIVIFFTIGFTMSYTLAELDRFNTAITHSMGVK